MKISIHQPQYLPWLGYFDKIDQADVFVILDDVQYKKNEWQNRNKIRNAESWQWITVPVMYEFGQKINDVRVDNAQPWRQKHLKSIEINYSHAPYFKEYFSAFNDILTEETGYIDEINTYFIKYFIKVLNINAESIKSSSLGIKTNSTERIVEICKALKADVYLSGAGGKDYLDVQQFKDQGIKLEFQQYEHPGYKQVFENFHPYMSVIDLLFCHGPESLNIIRGGRKQ